MIRPTARRFALAAAVAAAALTATGSALAHATVLPETALAGGQLYALSVPNEIDGASTTGVVLTVPDGFAIGLFQPSPGWERTVERAGTGEESTVRTVTWTATGDGEDEGALFQFTGRTPSPGAFTFAVEQRYSDGTVVDWAGDEGSELPAPVVTTKSSLAGGGTSFLVVVALAVGAVGVVLGVLALVRRRSGERA